MIGRVALILFVAHLQLPAQQEINYIFTLDNGAAVLYQSYSEVSMNDQEKAFGKTEASGNIIRRTLLDNQRRPWLAFELHIDRLPGTPIQFRLSMEPLGGWRFFGRAAEPRIINNGDRILLDVLEQPDTGRKVFDTFQVGINVPMQIMPMPLAIPQVPTGETTLHLRSPSLVQHGRTLGESNGELSGTRIAIAVPGFGRFIFSNRPEPGFRMEGIAQSKSISFVVGNDSYEIVSASQVIAQPGSWYVWVRQELDPLTPISVPSIELRKSAEPGSKGPPGIVSPPNSPQR